MHIYFSGIGGAGLSALAHIAFDAGYQVSGSDLDLDTSACQQLEQRGAQLGSQDGQFINDVHQSQPIDWVVYSSAIPTDSLERTTATKLNLRSSKRDEFLNHILAEHNLKLLAVAGTHGKTTTTAMVAWVLQELGPVSWLIGSELSFGRSGQLATGSQWLVLEADEYDRHMLSYHPQLSLLPSIDYDHADIYPTIEDYHQAFRDFIQQSELSVGWLADAQRIGLGRSTGFHALEQPSLDYDQLPLVGSHTRANAELVATGLELAGLAKAEQALTRLESFPGTARRFERLSSKLITDYAHHPTEIKATIELADEYRNINQLNKLVVVYQPHQDKRQRQIRTDYADAFAGVDQIYWLPTYDPPGRTEQPPLTPAELRSELNDPQRASTAELDNQLLSKIRSHLAANDLVVVMGAGDVDRFIRSAQLG